MQIDPPAPDPMAVANLYEDNCSVIVTLITPMGNIVSNDDCGWEVDYIFRIEDECGNAVNCTVTHMGLDNEAPMTQMSDCTSLDMIGLNICMADCPHLHLPRL